MNTESRNLLIGSIFALLGTAGLYINTIVDNEYSSRTSFELKEKFAASCQMPRTSTNNKPLVSNNMEKSNAPVNSMDIKSDFVEACIERRIKYKNDSIFWEKLAASMAILIGMYKLLEGFNARENSTKPNSLKP